MGWRAAAAAAAPGPATVGVRLDGESTLALLLSGGERTDG